jgi:hypothetical protein
LFFSFEEGGYLGPSTVRLNSGVFVWKNSPETHRFIEATVAQTRFLEHKWWDQAGMIAALGLWSHFDDDNHGPDQPTDLFPLVKRIPQRWNCSMGCVVMPEAIIRHFIAMRPGGKLFGLQLDAMLGERDHAKESEFQLVIKEHLWPLTMRSEHIPPRKQNKQKRPISLLSKFMRRLSTR